jgi:hypothetical protein
VLEVVAAATGAVVFAAGFGVEGAVAASPAQAGTTRIKANKNKSMCFMVILLLRLAKFGLPDVEAARQQPSLFCPDNL